MSLTRTAHTLTVATITGVLALTAYTAAADSASAPAVTGGHHAAAHPSHPARDAVFVAPVPHKYGANGMRMGLHCETSDFS